MDLRSKKKIMHKISWIGHRQFLLVLPWTCKHARVAHPWTHGPCCCLPSEPSDACTDLRIARPAGHAFCITALALKRGACYAYTHRLLLELARSTSLDFNVEEEQSVFRWEGTPAAWCVQVCTTHAYPLCFVRYILWLGGVWLQKGP